jgi:hypothetical protein
MSEAIKLIVDGYLTLKDRQALETLRARHQRLRKQLQERPKRWVDVGPLERLFDEELRVIEAGIDRL